MYKNFIMYNKVGEWWVVSWLEGRRTVSAMRIVVDSACCHVQRHRCCHNPLSWLGMVPFVQLLLRLKLTVSQLHQESCHGSCRQILNTQWWCIYRSVPRWYTRSWRQLSRHEVILLACRSHCVWWEGFHCIILSISISHLHHNADSSIDLDCCRFKLYPKTYSFNSWGLDTDMSTSEGGWGHQISGRHLALNERGEESTLSLLTNLLPDRVLVLEVDVHTR